MTTRINVSKLIDDSPFGRVQITVVVLCALINMLDGMDTQSIGVAAPMIAQALNFPLPEFGPVFSAALFGATLGAVVFGAIADKIGRKRLLVLSALLIGVFTLLTATAQSLPVLMTYRFLAGIGLGGATPCFIALTSEYAPARYRAATVTVMWAGFPFGAMIGGFTNSLLIADFGWRAIFYLGGVLPLILALALAIYLPESLKFLLTRQTAGAQALRIVQRLGVVDADARTVLTADEEKITGAPIRHVFREGRALGTFLLWVPFFTSFGILTVVVLWTPTLLRLNGISPAATAFVVAFNGLGGMIGQAFSGRLIERFGIVPILFPSFVLGAFVTAGLGYFASSVALAALFTGLTGLFLGFASGGAIALAALIYPTAVRSSGIGLGMAMGRFGQVVGPLIAGAMLGVHFTAAQIMVAIGSGALIGALFTLFFKAWLTSHSNTSRDMMETELA